MRLSQFPSLINYHQRKMIRYVSKFSIDDILSNYVTSTPKPKLRTHYVDIFNGNFDNKHNLNGDNLSFNDKLDLKSLYDEENKKGEKYEQVLHHREEYEKKRLRWENNAHKPERVQYLDNRGQSYGRGGRKRASARVWIYPGDGVVTVNRRTFLDYFPRESHRELIVSPFVATQTCGLFDTMVTVEGGGLSGQAGAIRHGLSRALERYNPDFRLVLKQLGFLTRDSREVERKKIGLKKARKAPQWVRR